MSGDFEETDQNFPRVADSLSLTFLMVALGMVDIVNALLILLISISMGVTIFSARLHLLAICRTTVPVSVRIG